MEIIYLNIRHARQIPSSTSHWNHIERYIFFKLKLIRESFDVTNISKSAIVNERRKKMNPSCTLTTEDLEKAQTLTVLTDKANVNSIKTLPIAVSFPAAKESGWFGENSRKFSREPHTVVINDLAPLTLSPTNIHGKVSIGCSKT